LERDVQVGEEWEDKDFGVETIALSPDGKTIANGSLDGTYDVESEVYMLEYRRRASIERMPRWNVHGVRCH
jgi:hypothetical protein